MITALPRRLRTLFGDRTASTAVEFALVLLPLTLMVGGTVEFGRYLWVQHTLEEACEKATHYIYAHSTAGVDTLAAQMPTQVRNALIGLDPAPLSVATEISTLNTVSFIKITATYPFSFAGITGLPSTEVTAVAKAPVE
jgi:Flp pilus assembly protein TadG